MVLNHWNGVPAAHRRWIFINSIVISAVSNVAFNGFGSLLAAHGRHHVPLWSAPVTGGPNLILSPIGTLFFLPFATCIGVHFAVRNAYKKGVLTRRESHQRGPAWLSTLPPGRHRRGTKVGLMAVVAGGPVVILTMAIGFGGGMSISAFVIFSALFGLFLGLTVTPYIALAAMANYEDTKTSESVDK
jgi:hypothetical protein